VAGVLSSGGGPQSAVSTRRISLAAVMSWAALTEPENDIRTWINE
jgi:hypothetical protein